jgi:hypothetical protein
MFILQNWSTLPSPPKVGKQMSYLFSIISSKPKMAVLPASSENGLSVGSSKRPGFSFSAKRKLQVNLKTALWYHYQRLIFRPHFTVIGLKTCYWVAV